MTYGYVNVACQRRRSAGFASISAADNDSVFLSAVRRLSLFEELASAFAAVTASVFAMIPWKNLRSMASVNGGVES
jgi:hypothetical protein